jgi:hypothetical protein
MDRNPNDAVTRVYYQQQQALSISTANMVFVHLAEFHNFRRRHRKHTANQITIGNYNQDKDLLPGSFARDRDDHHGA